MIRIFLSRKLLASLANQDAATRQEVESGLNALFDRFGSPHEHSGLGLRKLRGSAYEMRVGLDLRLVMVLKGERLTCIDLMNHDQVKRWLKG